MTRPNMRTAWLLAQLGDDVEKMISRMRRPEVVADLRHLRQWLADVVAELDGVGVEP